MSGRRLYLGRLPADARPEDVQKHFEGYGKINECRVMTGFGFVEFETTKDAEDVVHQFNGKSFLNQPSIIVEFAKESRRREDRDYRTDSGRPPPPRTMGRRPPGFRINVSGISRDTSWQDLKDFGREAGSVSFADVDRDNAGRGVLEYLSRDDAEHAVRSLDGKDLRGVTVRLMMDDPRDSRRGGSPPPRRSRSPYGGGGGGGRRDDRRRSRSPPPRRYDDRRGGGEDREYGSRGGRGGERGGYDDRRDTRERDHYDDRRGGGDDRRGGGGYDDRVRDDDRDGWGGSAPVAAPAPAA